MKSMPLLFSYQHTIAQRTHELFKPLDDKTQLHQNLVTAWRALKYRSTSVSSDETFCLTNLLNMDSERFFSIPYATDPTVRMIEFWHMFKRIPIEFAFRCGEKIDIPGLRWARKTLLRNSLGLDDDRIWKRHSRRYLLINVWLKDQNMVYNSIAEAMICSYPSPRLSVTASHSRRRTDHGIEPQTARRSR